MSFPQWNAGGRDQKLTSGVDSLKVGLIFVGVVYVIVLVGLLVCLFLKCLEKIEELNLRASTRISVADEEAAAPATVADVATVPTRVAKEVPWKYTTHTSVIVRIADKLFEFILQGRKNSNGHLLTGDGHLLTGDGHGAPPNEAYKIDIEPASEPAEVPAENGLLLSQCNSLV